jgi:hypothetical protein
MASSRTEKYAVFLNLPYDDSFTDLYLAYIVAVSSFGLVPHATVGIAGERRLDRIAQLIKKCTFSLHDLSRVELDTSEPPTPRFNMPFELGFAVGWSRSNPSHRWFVFEAVLRRIHKSLSDMDGTDVYIHGGTVEGIMREVGNAFVSAMRQPTVPEMMRLYKKLHRIVPQVQRNAGSTTVFTARCFAEISLAAAMLAKRYLIT